ncbi:FAD-binding domain-containing protein [Ruegeria arenilitoris]|uniref:FAD-binding domain-containing protein n=1 Tax=Ruegeria arenilitoris TaxID=1173585 RepID=UPI00147E7041|nr:FAD-binding domain-containing protein [Ruegeria arenilitoris]
MNSRSLPANEPDIQTVDWTPTRSAGLKRLEQFVGRSGQAYADTRNFDLGPADRSNTTALSPWIRHRLITEVDVLSAVLARHNPVECEKFVQEVFWRGYFKGWLEQRPSVWASYLQDLDSALQDPGSDYEDAISGRTGIDCFDAWAAELVETGYLHNHARMWFASIWIFTLGLPWQLGADFFLQHLMDADPASNTLSWRWVGGLHTKGKTYLARAENIARYTNGRFHPKGLAATAIPLTESVAHPVCPIPPLAAPPDGPFLLLLTLEDVGGAALMPHEPEAVVGLHGPVDSRSARPQTDFAFGALGHALAKWRQDPIAVRDWAEPLLNKVEATGVRRIVTPYAPIGPVRSALDAAEPLLIWQGIEVIRVWRGYDSLVWPHATRGFFGLKKQIPQFLKDLHLTE